MPGAPEFPIFDPELLIRTLAHHEVRYVLIGALAARLYGFPRLTADADITPDRARENLRRLATALRALDAKVYTESVPEGLVFDCSSATLERASMWNLITAAGRVDVAFQPAGTRGYEDLAAEAERFDAFGVQFLVASLADVIRSKEATGRTKDREDAVILRALQRRLEAQSRKKSPQKRRKR